jgi:guanylate kinase/DNA-binding response OmpR family regulator
VEGRSKRILIFEKDRNFAMLIERILKNDGCEVETVSSLLDAQHRTTKRELDVLIVGKYPGCEHEAEALKGINSHLRKILIARWPDVLDIFILVEAGFDDYVALKSNTFCSFEAKNLKLTIRGVGGRKDKDFQAETRGEKVLVFDEESKTDLEKVFAEAGFGNVSKTGDLKEALKIVKDKVPDILAADFTFPHTVHFLKEVKVNPRLPVILVSESNIAFPPENLFWYYDYFMIKPVRANDIIVAAEFLQEESCFKLPQLRARKPDEIGVNFYLAGPYGAGKSTIARLLSDHDVIGPFGDSIRTLNPYPRYITRKLWPKEKKGVDYYSVTEAAFDELLRRGKEIDWKRVDWRKRIEGIEAFYHLEGIRVSADIPLPVGGDFLIAPALKGFEKMAPEDPHANCIFFGISFETMKKRQLDRPESDRDKRTPKTLEEYKKYITMFDPYFPGRTSHGIPIKSVKYGLMILNEEGSNPYGHQENELNRMRKIAVRLAWYIKHVREGLSDRNA